MAWSGNIITSKGEESYNSLGKLALLIIKQYLSLNPKATLQEIRDYFDTCEKPIRFKSVNEPIVKSNGYYTDETIKIDGDDYYIQRWSGNEIAPLEIFARDNLNCEIHRYKNGDGPDMAYKTEDEIDNSAADEDSDGALVAIPDNADLGFSVKRVIWDAIKYCVSTYEISSLQELQDFFPSDYITFIRGRFLQFDSGELLAEYPQWEIKDGYKLLKFIESKGYFNPYSDNAVNLSEESHNSSPRDEVYINKFRYESGGGMIMMYTDPRRLFTEIDRDNCIIETFKQEVDYRGNHGKKEEIHQYSVPKDLVESFFNELEIANWEDGPFMRSAGLDCPMWYIDLNYSDGSNLHTQGSGGDGPKNLLRIQQRYIDLMKKAGLSEHKIFFTH